MTRDPRGGWNSIARHAPDEFKRREAIYEAGRARGATWRDMAEEVRPGLTGSAWQKWCQVNGLHEEGDA